MYSYQDGYLGNQAYFVEYASFGPEKSLQEMYDKELEQFLENNTNDNYNNYYDSNSNVESHWEM